MRSGICSGVPGFFFAPSLNLDLKNQKSRWREIDIVCVINGELLIGEVKGGEITKADFTRFAATAKVVRPDRASVFVDLDRLDQNMHSWFERNEGRASRGRDSGGPSRPCPFLN
jgi:hypothetical protein